MSRIRAGRVKLFFRFYFFMELDLNSRWLFFLGGWTTSKAIYAEKPTELHIKYQGMYWTKVYIFVLIKKEKNKKEMSLLAACFSYILKKQDLILVAFEFNCNCAMLPIWSFFCSCFFEFGLAKETFKDFRTSQPGDSFLTLSLFDPVNGGCPIR